MNIEKLYLKWEESLKGIDRELFNDTMPHRKWCCENFAKFVINKSSKPSLNSSSKKDCYKCNKKEICDDYKFGKRNGCGFYTKRSPS